jgi:phosphatidate cytidylyltransferase
METTISSGPKIPLPSDFVNSAGSADSAPSLLTDSRSRETEQRRHAIKERIITGIIALPALILYVYFAGPFLFSLLVFVVTALALNEFHQIVLPDERWVERHLATGLGALLSLLIASMNMVPAFAGMSLVTVFWLAWFLFRFHDLETVMQQIGLIFLGIFYLVIPLAHLGALATLESGKLWIFFILLLTMASDTAAYFVGVSLGRHKLYPAISPNKSIEGAVGGMAGAALAVVIAAIWFLPELGFLDGLFLALILGPLAQIGDLVESMLKRSFGVKDSGVLIPGHGGLLDRLDSLILIFPVVYYFALLKGF